MTKKKTVTKRNPQDATLRNVRSASKRLTELERRVAELLQRVENLEHDLNASW